jgi:hypothetical protein
MATTGGLVVTNTFGPKTADALTSISPSIRAAAPDVEALIEALAAAVADVHAGAFQAAPPVLPETWDEALGTTVAWLDRQLRSLWTG